MRPTEFARIWYPLFMMFLILFIVVGDMPPMRPWVLLRISKTCYTAARVIGRAGLIAEAAYVAAIKNASLAG